MSNHAVYIGFRRHILVVRTILDDGNEAYFNAKIHSLQDEFLLHQYHLQLEKENELFRKI